MSVSLTAIGYFVLSVAAHSPGHAANLFRELDYPSLEVARGAVQDALEKRTQGETERWVVPGWPVERSHRSEHGKAIPVTGAGNSRKPCSSPTDALRQRALCGAGPETAGGN